MQAERKSAAAMTLPSQASLQVTDPTSRSEVIWRKLSLCTKWGVFHDLVIVNLLVDRPSLLVFLRSNDSSKEYGRILLHIQCIFS